LCLCLVKVIVGGNAYLGLGKFSLSAIYLFYTDLVIIARNIQKFCVYYWCYQCC